FASSQDKMILPLFICANYTAYDLMVMFYVLLKGISLFIVYKTAEILYGMVLYDAVHRNSNSVNTINIILFAIRYYMDG
ncbi:MAG: hypothetical protein M3264_06635, partial [Thermoproteota archaeon]|nr:hypothetical protein [Thermoproteota archaeon]